MATAVRAYGNTHHSTIITVPKRGVMLDFPLLLRLLTQRHHGYGVSSGLTSSK